MDMPDREAAQELGSIAHGPVLLAAGDGVAVGLRCVFAHPTGLHLPIVLVARAVHADAAARRLRGHGDELRVELGPTAGSATIRLNAFASQGAGGEDEYRQESSYWYAGLPSGPTVTVTVAWPAIGLSPATTVLHLPDLARVARAVVPLR
ncbi:MAG TPA: hypothetical protein VIC62_15005 [Nakamurella sp.]